VAAALSEKKTSVSMLELWLWYSI